MNDFINVIEDLILLFQDLIQIEQTKLEAVKNNRITYVEDCMNREQAAIMRMRGLDKKRESCQEKLGFKNYTFQQILTESKNHESLQLKQLFDKLSNQVRQFQRVNEGVHSLIEINLYSINKTISKSRDGKNSDNVRWEG